MELFYTADGETLKSYREILKSYGISGTDYVKENGGPATIFNMGLNGLFAVIFVLAVGGDLNGPTIGSIFTIVGFSATGKHIRNIFPIMLGVCLGGITKTWNIYDPSAILALLLSTTWPLLQENSGGRQVFLQDFCILPWP